MSHNSYLILGGARSGKTRHALQLAVSLETPHTEKIYVATAEALDDEMKSRIAHHKQERDGQNWTTVECPIALSETLTCFSEHSIFLVDCLTLWLSNIMHQKLDILNEVNELIAALSKFQAKVIFVSNEVGLGIVPDSKLGRDFRDEQGRLNQRLAEHVDRVDFIVAGLPMRVK